MYLTPTLLVCLLLGQAAGDGRSRIDPVPALPGLAPLKVLPEPTIPQTPGGSEDRAVNPPAPGESHRPTPAQVVADLCRLPQDAAIAGNPLSLVQAISYARDRKQQADVIHAYWRLTQAVAEYHICFEAERQLGPLQAREEAGTILLTAKAAAKASLQAARVAASRAQYDLAAAAQLPPDTLPPLAANLPFTGPYRTSFDEIASRPLLPPAARLLNRTLPDNYQAIQQRLAALHEADNALAAATELYQAGQGDLPVLLRCHDAFVSQQRIFMTDVCDYNYRIVDYVLSVLQRQATSQALVDMLIVTEHSIRVPAGTPAKSGRDGAPPGNSGLDVDPNAVRAASDQEPLPTGSSPPRKERSILQRSSADRVLAAAPAFRPPDAGAPRAAGQPVPSGARVDNPPVAPAPSLSAASAPAGPLVPVPPPASLPGPRTAQMQTTRSTDPKTLELFSFLAEKEKSPASRAQELSAFLHASARETGVKAVELGDCLRLARPADRRGVITAYWLARQRAAEHQWLLHEREWLEQLDQPARDHRAASPAGRLESVRVYAAREAVNADLLESSIALLEAEFDLTYRCGAPTGSPWFMPVTPPHAGPYDLKQGSLSPQVSQSWPVRRLVDVIPGYLNDLQQRATAAVQADVARAAFTATYQEGNAAVETVLTQIEKETAEVRSFLQTATRYNQSIADYVLLVAPPSIDAERLSRALVIPRTQPAAKPF